MMADETMKLFLKISMHRMCHQYLPKIRRCLAVLERHQTWEHGFNQANSIGGILFHICEHIQKNTLLCQDKKIVFPSGIQNYFPDTELPNEDLVCKVEEVFSAWETVMKRAMADASAQIDIHRTYHLVEHTSYHLGQIVDRVQMATGKRFGFVQSGLDEQALRALTEQD